MPFETKDEVNMYNAYNSPLLDFISNTEKVNRITGEIFFIKKRKYLNLNFTFKSNSQHKLQELVIRGSVHTFFNDGLHNADILTFQNFKTALNKYSELFGLDLSKCILKPFEYGINLYLCEFSKYDLDEILPYVFCIKRKMFNPNNGIESSLISGTNSTEIRLKFYSKSIQLPKYCINTVRVEKKPNKTRSATSLGVKYVSDLYDVKNHIILFENFLGYISKIVLYDYTINLPNHSKYLKDVRKFKNLNYWRKLIKECSKGNDYFSKYNDEVSKLNKLSEKYGTNLLSKLEQQAKTQSIKALGLCSFSEYQIIKTPKNAHKIKPKNAPLYIGCMSYCNGIVFYKASDVTTSKTCLVTGLDISMQKTNSSLLSHTGLNYYFNNDKKVFELIKNKYLSTKWQSAEHKKQIIEIAHNIRNCISNSRIKQSKLYPKNQPLLFAI